MSPITIATIATTQQLPRASALMASAQRHWPDAGRSILVADGDDSSIPGPGLRDIGLEPDVLSRMQFMYDEDEFVGALRPHLVRHLLAQHGGAVVLLPPSAYLFSPLDRHVQLAEESGLALSIARHTPVPDDGLLPDMGHLRRGGVFGASAVTITRAADSFLAWWCDRTLVDAINELESGLAGAQGWLDSAPSLYDHHVDHDPGLGVGYWNLDERSIEYVEGRLLCDSSPISLVDFRGYNPNRPWSLSDDIADNPRVVFSEHGELARLYDDYGQALAAADPQSDRPYVFGELPGGVGIPGALRRMYRRDYLIARRSGGSLPPVPDSVENFANLRDYFGRPAGDKPRLSEYASMIWRGRADLMAAFPRPEHQQFEAFQDWLADDGVRSKAVPEGWALTDRASVRKESVLADTIGVNVFGYFSSELGLGEAGRLLLQAVEESGLPCTTHVSVRNSSRQAGDFIPRAGRNRFPINLVAINADHFVHWYDQWGDRFAPGAYTIGFWAWELEEFPDRMLGALQYVDEIWAISGFVAQSIRRQVDIPVRVFPFPTKTEPSFPRATFLPIPADRAYFAFAFDYLSEAERKNPTGLIDAFKLAFPKQDGPALVVKSMNGDLRRTAREKVRAAAEGRHDVVLVDDYVSREDMQGFIEHALAFVSLHRSEGFGLGMFEAMSKGVPSIATGYSGNLEFMTAENSILLPYSRVSTGKDSGPYVGGGEWAEPSVHAAAEAMRRLARDPAAARALGHVAQCDLAERFALDKSADFVRSTIREAFRARLARRVPSTLRQPVPYHPRLLTPSP